jgi:hypothetical protein
MARYIQRPENALKRAQGELNFDLPRGFFQIFFSRSFSLTLSLSCLAKITNPLKWPK